MIEGLGRLVVLVVLSGALATGCIFNSRSAVGQWYDVEHDFELTLDHDRAGYAQFWSESKRARYTLNWRKRGGKYRVELYCRESYSPNGQCGDSGSEDFELECEFFKEAKDERTDEGENEELICTGPDETYYFEPVI